MPRQILTIAVLGLFLGACGPQKTGSPEACNYDTFPTLQPDGLSFRPLSRQDLATVNQMNCLLDQFAYNNFLYLLGTDQTDPRFMSYATADQLFVANGEPVWPAGFSPLSTTELVDKQAGDGYILLDVAGGETKYDIRMNETYFEYVAEKSLYKRTVFDQAVTDFNANSGTGGVWFPPTSEGDTSEGAVEIKTSWRPFGPAKCPDDLMHCQQDAQGNTWGLVGFHLVQKTVNQPGFVWATFEHVANAPDCDPGGNNPISRLPISPATGQPINVNKNIPGLMQETGWNYFNYFTYEAGGGDGKSCSYPQNREQDTQCLGYPGTPPNTKKINICRTQALPVCDPSGDDAENLNTVACLNQSMLDNFPASLPDMWKNYRLIGMEWLDNGQTGFGVFIPACFTYDAVGPFDQACPNFGTGTQYSLGRVGSEHLANSTMETWMQYQMNLNDDASATDCLSCHQPPTAAFGQGDMSHMFGRIRQ